MKSDKTNIKMTESKNGLPKFRCEYCGTSEASGGAFFQAEKIEE